MSADTKPRVLVVAWYPADDPASGERVRLHALCAALSEDWEVHLASFAPSEGAAPHPWQDHRAPEKARRPYAYRLRDRVTAALTLQSVHRLVLRGRGPRRWMREVLREVEPDSVLLTQLPPASVVPPRYWERAVLDSHNAEYLRLRRIHDGAGTRLLRPALHLQALLARRLERRLGRRCAAVWAVSEEDAAYFRGLGARRVDVVPNGAHLAGGVPQVTPPREGLLFVGSLGYSANRAALAEFAQDWAPALPVPWRLDIVGSGELDPGTARAVSNDQRMRLIGRVDDIGREYSSHEALIAPLREGGGTRLKVLEACAAGLPVIATAVAVEGVGLEDGVSYLRAESGPEAASQLLWLRENAEEAARLREAALNHVRRFDWERIGRSASLHLLGLLSSNAAVRRSAADSGSAVPGGRRLQG